MTPVWYCSSCNQDIYEDKIQHFQQQHYFRPRQQPIQQEEQDFDFWYHECITTTICPQCRLTTDMKISATEKGVKITCQNTECKKVFFYRKVILERTNTPRT